MSNLIPEVLADVVAAARAIADTDLNKNRQQKMEEILYPFFESLGYSVTRVGDIVIAPIFSGDGEQKFEYGLSGLDPDSLKTVVAVVDNLDTDSDNGLARSRRCLQDLPPESKMLPDYLMVTDCIRYSIYDVVAKTRELRLIMTFDLRSVNPSALDTMQLLCNPQSEARQWFAVSREDRFNAVNDILNDDSNSEPSPRYNDEEDKKKDKPNILVRFLWPLLVGLLCILIIILSIWFSVRYGRITTHWYHVPLDHTNVTLPLTDLQGRLSVVPEKNYRLSVSLDNTNLPANTLVNIVCVNGENVQKFPLKVKADGRAAALLDLTSGWPEGAMTVQAELIFGSEQTDEACTKFGAAGENIIGGKLGMYGYVIDSVKMTYRKDSSGEAYTSSDDPNNPGPSGPTQSYTDVLNNYEVVLYSNGDVGIYPFGYSTDDWNSNNSNITSTNKSYCKVFWRESEQKATLYYVAGTMMAQASWVKGTYILSDGANEYHLDVSYGDWKWHVNSFNSVTGWCRFDETGIANLIPILKAIYSTKQPTIEFKNLNQKLYISDDDKQAVLSVISVYEKWFSSPGKPGLIEFIQSQ